MQVDTISKIGSDVMSGQKYWDACLIRTWRVHGTVEDMCKMFWATTHHNGLDSLALLRKPTGYFNSHQPVRAWVAARLPKISERLWNQEPDKDVALLRKLETSKYTTVTSGAIIPDAERSKMRADLRKDNAKLKFTMNEIANRNSSTDWGTMSGGRTKAARGARK